MVRHEVQGLPVHEDPERQAPRPHVRGERLRRGRVVVAALGLVQQEGGDLEGSCSPKNVGELNGTRMKVFTS